MSWFRALSDAALTLCKGIPTRPRVGDCNKLAQYVPESFTLPELAGAAREPLRRAYSAKPKETFMMQAALLSLLACLYCQAHIRKTPEDEGAIQELAQSIAEAIAPAVTQDQSSNDDNEAASNDGRTAIHLQVFGYCKGVAYLGIDILRVLMEQTDRLRLHDEVLLTLLVFTGERQNWATPRTWASAGGLLEQQFTAAGVAKEQFITETVLHGYLRPLFSKSKPASITASGRKAEYTDSAATRGESMPDESALTKPWKYTDLRAIPALAWAVREADNQLVAKHWPLFIPVLLTLADDPTTPIRRQGLLILTDFLAKFPDKTLQDTGLAKVFEDAIFPTLAFLPSLTPEQESVQLLSPAYDALLRLSNKQPPVAEGGIPNGAKNSLLDKMLRDGVFTGYFHAKEHVSVVDALCQQTTAILTEMGIHSVKHLKDLIPMLSSIMTDPFAPVAPATLLSAIKALQAVLANCWPRIPGSPWQDEIINALVLCWLHLADHNHADTDATYGVIKQELLISSKALAAVLKTAEGGPIDLSAHAEPLVAKDPRLRDLFPPSN